MEHKALTREKFVEILQKHESTQDVKLIKVDLKSGAEKGQNYSGLVVACHLEAKIKGQSKTYNWMAKVPLDDPNRFDMVRGSFIDKNELIFYDELVPAFKAFLASKGSDIKLDFCPCVYTDFKEDIPREQCALESMLIMEHLAQFGYTEPIEKKSGLDLAHVKLAMRSLANFHATSYAFFKNKHGSVENMVEKEPILARDYFVAQPTESMASLMDQFNQGMLLSSLSSLANSDANGNKYVESYMRFAKEKMEPLKLRAQLTEPGACKFNVLCHGDPWFNNMLFKYEEGPHGTKPVDICWVDLALTKWASPTTDISYFMYMSTTSELRKAHMNEILELYHQTLCSALKSVGEDPNLISLSELTADYKKCSFYGFMMSFMFLPMLLARKEDVLGADEFTGDFKDPNVMEDMAKMMKERIKIMMENEPKIGHRISTGFLEMVENGYFTL